MKVKLLEPVDGYEDVAEYRRVQHGHVILDMRGRATKTYPAGVTAIVLTPKVKKYDWDKTDGRALIDYSGAITFYDGYKHRRTFLSTEWIPHNGGECPFDEEAVIVEVRFRSEIFATQHASDFNWESDGSIGDIIAVRFVKLIEGYEW